MPNFYSPSDLEAAYRSNAKLREMCHSFMKELDASITSCLLSAYDFDYYRTFACALIAMLVSGETECLEGLEDAEE